MKHSVCLLYTSRKEIVRLGGEVRFHSKATDLVIEGNQLRGILVNETEQLDAEIADVYKRQERNEDP